MSTSRGTIAHCPYPEWNNRWIRVALPGATLDGDAPTTWP